MLSEYAPSELDQEQYRKIEKQYLLPDPPGKLRLQLSDGPENSFIWKITRELRWRREPSMRWLP